MSEVRHFSLYCDESCHIENDHIPVMVWGAVYCETDEVRSISAELRSIKAEHGVGGNFEAKWTKVSPAKLPLYLALIDKFLDDPRLRFRGLLVPDKSLLNHGQFEQTHDEWYYKMYFTMLRYIFRPPHHYRIYLDVKDTRGGPKARALHEVLANSIHDFNKEAIERVQQVRSHESELLQLADLLIGAVGYANRGLKTSAAKQEILARLAATLGPQALMRTSAFAATKFNLLAWNAQVAG